MTEKQIEKMKKYVDLMRLTALKMVSCVEDWKLLMRYNNVYNYLILRMEREMKR